jgi:hypothetical protein
MTLATSLAAKVRSPGDPRILETGPSSRGTSDNTAKNLGWFSFALGLTELLATRELTRALGMEGKETLVRAFGAREIAAGMACLATNSTPGVWSRVAGDALDIAVLLSAFRNDNPKKRNVGIALATVAGITLIDIATATALNARHRRPKGPQRDYSERSGLPLGIERSRGAAISSEMQAAPPAAAASPVDGRTSPASASIGV